MAGSGITSRRWGWAIGAVATLLGVAVYLAGWLERLDGYNLDLHFRHFNTLQADPRIVLIDIDDSTLQAMPDWPWPRRVFADLVRTIDESRPKAIVLDLVFDLPSRPRAEHPGLSRDYDIDTASPEIGDRAFDEIVYDDRELQEALERAGNVYLAMFARTSPPDLGLVERVSAWGDPLFPIPSPTRKHPFEWHANNSAQLFFEANPDGTWPEFFRSFSPSSDIDAQNVDRELLLQAYRREKAVRVAAAKFSAVPANRQDRLIKAYDLSPPLCALSQAAAGVGLVSFRWGNSEQTLRSIPGYVEVRGRSVPQLGVQVATAVLGAPDKVPFGRLSQVLVNWHRPTGSWRNAFVHLPAARPLEVVQNRRAIHENSIRLPLARAELVRVRHADTPATYDDYVKRVNARIEAKRLKSPEPDGLRVVDEPLIAQIENEAIEWLKRAWALWKDETPRNEEEIAERDRIKSLYDRFGEGRYAAILDAANKKLEARNAELNAELSPMLRDKIVLVGYTATAMADMVPTPVDPAMPGVMVHANVINMFLQNRFASAAEPPVNVLLMLISGAVTAFAAVRGRTRVSVAALFAVILVLLAGGAALFYQTTYHIASLATVVCVLLTWGCVTVHRQSTDERSRRKLQRALSQYTSPAVATRIAEQARGDTLAPQTAHVTCFFSDLSGFTALSEKLGPQRTREALDPYLREVSAVIMAQQGMVNKFIGDGVFAFFNAPILPRPNHAAAACEAALLAAKRVHAANLSVRIGLSTGDAFVGDYGSEQKLDYTCIGDTVNVGQRLERANKFFGTTILVDESTRQAAGDGFAFRSLGWIAVPGRSAAVSAFELVGRAGEVSAEAQAEMASFEEAIRCFQTCQWDSCLSLLAERLRPDPTDQAAARYERAAKRLRITPPPPDWNGSIDASDF